MTKQKILATARQVAAEAGPPLAIAALTALLTGGSVKKAVGGAAKDLLLARLAG